MAFDPKKYPPNWRTEIVPAILRRAGEVRDADGKITNEARCEFCQVPNHTKITRIKRGRKHRDIYANNRVYKVPFLDFQVVDYKSKYAGIVYIILTTAHLDRNRQNNDYSNLASLCQRCHLNHDRYAQHIPGAKFGRNYKETMQELEF